MPGRTKRVVSITKDGKQEQQISLLDFYYWLGEMAQTKGARAEEFADGGCRVFTARGEEYVCSITRD